MSTSLDKPEEVNEGLSNSVQGNVDDRIHVNNHITVAANERSWDVLGTLALGGAIFAFSYALATKGWLEVASTMLTMYFVQLGRLLFKNGILALPASKGEKDESFTETKNHLRTMLDEFNDWQARSTMFRLAALAMVYTASFMTFRFVMSKALLVFTNMWVAIGVGLVFTAAIVAPNKFKKAFDKFNETKNRK